MRSAQAFLPVFNELQAQGQRRTELEEVGIRVALLTGEDFNLLVSQSVKRKRPTYVSGGCFASRARLSQPKN